MENSSKQSVWTVWSAYGTVGEGVTYAALVGYASTAPDAVNQFKLRFGSSLTTHAECGPGVVVNGVTRKLFSPEAFETMRHADGQADLSAQASLHVHYP